MWEEDPRYQESNYRFLKLVVVVGSLLMALYGALTGEWDVPGWWFFSVVGVLIALGLYAAAVWGIGHGIAWIFRFVRSTFRKGRHHAQQDSPPNRR